MTLSVFATIFMLLSAILHAIVSLLLKQAGDKLVFRAALSLISALILFPFIFVFPFPPRESWSFLFIGLGVHYIYQIAMIGAFARGDMSLVYPLMRGSAPALAALAAFLILGESLTIVQMTGLALSILILIAFGWPKRLSNQKLYAFSAILLALICGVMIGLYATLDAGGARLTRQIDGQIWGYVVWLFLLDSLGISLTALVLRRRDIIKAFSQEIRRGLMASLLSLVGFSLAIYALSVAPVAQMSALRETSIVFGSILACLYLKEPFGQRRIILSIILAFGLILLQMG